jgi:hypothetical protein
MLWKVFEWTNDILRGPSVNRGETICRPCSEGVRESQYGNGGNHNASYYHRNSNLHDRFNE